MKPHRQIRSSNRVNSETGVSNSIDTPSKSNYQDALDKILNELKPFPPTMRKNLLAEAYKRLQDN